MIVGGVVLFFVKHVLQFICHILFVNNSRGCVFRVARVGQYGSHAYFYRIVKVLLSLASVAGGRSFRVFFASIQNSGAFSSYCLIVLVMGLLGTWFTFVSRFRVSDSGTIIKDASYRNASVTTIVSSKASDDPKESRFYGSARGALSNSRIIVGPSPIVATFISRGNVVPISKVFKSCPYNGLKVINVFLVGVMGFLRTYRLYLILSRSIVLFHGAISLAFRLFIFLGRILFVAGVIFCVSGCVTSANSPLFGKGSGGANYLLG